MISDLHGDAPFIDDAKIAQVVRPDLILLTGDLNAPMYFNVGMPIDHVIEKLKPRRRR